MWKPVRILSAALVCGAALWFGLSFGPKPAEADVQLRVVRQVSEVASALGLDPAQGQVRRLHVNGSLLHTWVGESRLSPTQVGDRLDATLAARGDMPPRPEGEWGSSEAAEWVFGELARPFRLDLPGWTGYGRIMQPKPGHMLNAFERISAGLGLGPGFEPGFFVLAIDDPETKGSSIWWMRYDEGLNPFALVGADGGDVPGPDIPDVARFPGSRRVFSLVEQTDFGSVTIAVYEGAGTPTHHFRHYARALEAAGLARTAGSDPGVSDGAALFTGDGGHISIFSAPAADEPGRTLTLIQAHVEGRGRS
jgi:hypothetical protein